ncbi:MAG TPA: ATP-binding protein, partial [Polyangium sp.]|nr:ATP-binding protein [Polyangium sp.]
MIVSTPAELEGVLALESGRAGGWAKLQDHSGATYHVREFENIRGKPFSIAGTWLGPSDARALSRASDLVEELNPTWLVSPGVCDGFSEDDSLGDVLFAARVIDCRPMMNGDRLLNHNIHTKRPTYDLPSSMVINAPHIFNGFLLSDKVMTRWLPSFTSQVRWVLHALYDSNETNTDPRKHPDRREKCPDWVEVIKYLREWNYLDLDGGTLGLTEKGRKRVEDERLLYLDGLPEDRRPFVRHGILGTVPQKISDSSTLSELRRAPLGLAAMDRVSADLVQMAQKLDRKWMVIKSIVDFAERPSVPDYIPFGSRASAECALHVLQHIFAPEERHTPSIPTSRRDTFLESITIRNFKSIHHLHLDFLQQSALSGRWTCIAGLNGAGKSAILQAIALVLLGEKLALDVGSGSLARARRRTSEETLVAEIEATVRSGQENTIDLMLRIGENGVNDPPPQSDERAYQAMRDFWNTRRKHHLLLAYGAGRNLSEYRDSRYKNRIDDEAVRQMTLFDPLCQVASVDVLLEQGPRVLPILRMLKKLLDLVLVDVDLTVQESETGLAFRCGDAEVPASELPDGFRATIAWLADIC